MILSKKTIASLGSTINDSAKGSEVSSFAKKHMEKMGWSEGKGLGKHEDGISSHIKVKKVIDNEGLGARAEAKLLESSTDHWWHDGFASALSQVNGKSKKRKSKEIEQSSSKPPSFDDLFKATGGIRLGMRARADQRGKWMRAESIEGEIKEVSTSETEIIVITKDEKEKKKEKTKDEKEKKAKKDKKDKKEKKSKKEKEKKRSKRSE